MHRVIVSVTNDLTTDNRVDKVCRSVADCGYEVLLVGRMLKDSLELNRPYPTHRMKLLFNKGFLFYAEYNFRLFFFLLFRKAVVLHSNDLDTLAANCLASVFKRVPVVYDSHEYFTEVPEIVNRPAVQAVWKTIEEILFHVPAIVFTVNESIAGLFEEKYKRTVHIMRNIPEQKPLPARAGREHLGLPADRFILVLQGAGINVHRGSEELLESMRHLDDSYLLLILGNGDVVPWLKEKTAEWDLGERVRFMPRMPYKELIQYTREGDLGLTLDKPTNINYLYSLPNKVFDYIRAGIPVLSSNLTEVNRIVSGYDVGWVVDQPDAIKLAETIRYIRNCGQEYELKKNNTIKAAAALGWENEVKTLEKWYKAYNPN